jgi:hypothetical protein
MVTRHPSAVVELSPRPEANAGFHAALYRAVRENARPWERTRPEHELERERLESPLGRLPSGRPIDAATVASYGLLLGDYLGAAVVEWLPKVRPLRIEICSRARWIDDIPWEWLRFGDGGPAALEDGIELVRTAASAYPSPPEVLAGPMRVLVVLTNPKDERLLNPYRELDAVAGRLRGHDYAMTLVSKPDLEEFARALESTQPHVLHYIGHSGISGGAGHIILHDEHDGTYWLSATDLATRLPSTARLLCLSTCFTAPNYDIGGLPRIALSSGAPLPNVIANQHAVEGQSVAEFWHHFYEALVTGGDVVVAADGARRALAKSRPASGDWASFLIVQRDAGRSFELAWPSMRPRAAGLESLGAGEASSVSRLAAERMIAMANDLTLRAEVLPESARKELLAFAHDEAEKAFALLSGKKAETS